MAEIEANRWYTTDNEVIRFLWRLHVRIEMKAEDDKVYALLTVTDEEMNKESFRFNNLEDGIVFVQEYIKECKALVEVEEKYTEFQEKKKEQDKPVQKVKVDNRAKRRRK